MIQAKELVIDGNTTVSDLYKLIDMPYKITNKAKVTLAAEWPSFRYPENVQRPLLLRVEWEVEKGDPEV